jgi:cation diffusion facilitator family transporter
VASGSKKVIIAALLGNAAIAVVKFIAAGLTQSSAMLSEGIHSLVDTGNQALLLVGMKQAAKPADDKFPFGHARELYFWSFVVAILIFGVGSGISIYEGVHRLQDPHPVKNPIINYIVLGVAILFEGYVWMIAWREFKPRKRGRKVWRAIQESKDPGLFVVLFEDTAALLGLFIALAGISLGQLTNNPAFDGIAAILIGVVLAVTAFLLLVETKGLLIGESAHPETVEALRRMAADLECVENVNEVLTTHMGPDHVLVNISLEFKDDLRTGEIEQTTAALTDRIKQEFPEVKRVFIEPEPKS